LIPSDCGAFCVARFLQSIEAARRELSFPSNENPSNKRVYSSQSNGRQRKVAQAKTVGNRSRSVWAGEIKKSYTLMELEPIFFFIFFFFFLLLLLLWCYCSCPFVALKARASNALFFTLICRGCHLSLRDEMTFF